MANSVRCTGITHTVWGGVAVSFDDGSSQEFGDLETFQSYAMEADSPGDLTVAKRLLMRKLHLLSPDLSNPAALVGTRLNMDLAQVGPLEVVQGG